MSKFKVGERVRRIKDIYAGMEVGSIGTVSSVDIDSIDLKEYGNGHKSNNFELVESHYKPTSRSEFFNTKVRIRNEQESKSVQLAMFKRGFHWMSGGQEVQFLDAKYLYFYKDLDICQHPDEDCFLRSFEKEIFIEDILGKLINNKMDNVSILKEFDKKALVDARKEVSLERAEKQKEKAKEILRGIMDKKDEAEEVIKSTTESLSEIDESLKIFTKK